MSGAEAMKEAIAPLLKGIDRYNPDNLATLENYVQIQVQENTYDLDANLAVLKLYQLNIGYYQKGITTQILLKALMNLPHTDFTMCRCLIDEEHQQEETVAKVIYLAELLETCQFRMFWSELDKFSDLTDHITGFVNAIRRFITYVLSITYQTASINLVSDLLGGLVGSDLEQWINTHGWTVDSDGTVYIANQEAVVKSKNIVEKIDFEKVKDFMMAVR